MATVELTASAGLGRTVTVLVDDDTATRLAGRKLSIGSHGYAQIWDGGTRLLLHRWVLDIPTSARHGFVVDHINRDRYDCRRGNLRLVTPSENNINRTLRDRDLPLGVYPGRNKRYVAKLKRGRRVRHIGTFDTPEQAAAARAAAVAATDRPEFRQPAA